jgi:hypothetical protein
MTVLISAGNYQVGRANLGAYLGAVTGSTSVVVPAANGSNPRIDYVILRIREPTVDGSITASVTPMVLPGTASANPTETSAAAQVTDGDIVLAAVKVRAGTSSILQSDITDKRRFLAARGGIGVKAAADNTNGSYPGEYRDNQTTTTLDRWSGSAWVPVASPSVYTQMTPTLFAFGSGTNVALGTGSTAICRYNTVGKRLDFNYYFAFGTPPYNGGYGQIISYLPTGMIGAPYNQWFVCHLWVNLRDGVGAGAVSDWMGQAFVGANSNVVRPFFPINSGTQIMAPYQIAAAASTPNGGVPLIANNYPQGGQLTITGSIEIQ